MSIHQLLIAEISQQPEPILREVFHYLTFLKTQAAEPSPPVQSNIRTGFASCPGIILADDFDAPLPEFAEYRP